ncbi:MAG TPA: glycine cleavage system protein GcvH [Sedimentisphaerales bacterium]|nr:glycine cleavage system protein GcvH [Sedimentisphaerales bacterium]
MVVEGLFYTQEHEWVKIEGPVGVVGITDYAQDSLGEITFVELPAAGQVVKAKDEIAVVESSKAASDVYAPVGGKVVAVNSLLQLQPELINQSCYEDGWICRMEITDSRATGNLMDAKQYEEYVKGLS